MNTLYRYLRDYWILVVVALALAAINQIFSMLDPWIFRKIIDNYATRYHEYSLRQFIHGVSLLLGARIYADGIRHSLELPYADFEDQRSGETLGKLQKVRTDVEKLINIAVNLLFTTL